MADSNPAAWLAGLAMVVAGASTLAAARPPATHLVIVDKLKFEPETVEAHVGDAVAWANHDIFQHSATAADHSFDITLAPGGRGRITLTHAGIISYICRFHPGMKGQLRITK
jgi:plastocyanin